MLGLEKKLLKPKRVPVHWIEAPEKNRYKIGHFPVNFWQVPITKNSETSKIYTESYTLPVIGRSSQIKIAFHNQFSDCDPATLIRKVSTNELESIKAIILQFLPDLNGCSITSEVCMYTMTPDGHFYLGKRPKSNLVFGVALAGHGFKFAPVLGEILADLMDDRRPEIDIKLFSPDRFHSKKPTRISH